MSVGFNLMPIDMIPYRKICYFCAMKSNLICHIIVAAGRGSRYGADVPKQFCDMNGRPVLMTTIERLRRAGGDIILALSSEWVSQWLEMCSIYSFDSPEIVVGGDTRWQSVKNVLNTIPDDIEVVTVHDGARPLVDAPVTRNAVDAVLAGADGAIPAIGMTDTLRHIDADGNSVAVDRSRFVAVQTPQAFVAWKLKEAYSRPYSPLFTDDASVMEAAGFTNLVLTEGSRRNIKITNPGDIALACFYLSEEA